MRRSTGAEAAAAAAAAKFPASDRITISRVRPLNQFHTDGGALLSVPSWWRGVIGARACLFDHDGCTAVIGALIRRRPRTNICNRDQRQMNPFYGLAPN